MTLVNIGEFNHALKEWAIAVDALTAGKTIVLLRKGGIREQKFQVKHPLVWLYPTYEHQKPQLLKPEYTKSVMTVESGWHPTEVEIKSCAEITDVLPINHEAQIRALSPYHVWNEQMISDRLRWKPQQPVVVLLLKVYRLAQPKIIPYNNAYGGCKSWIDLVKPLATTKLTSAVSSDRYTQIVREIKDLLV